MKTPLNITVIIVVAGVIALLGAKMFSADQYHTAERIEWKDNAISDLGSIEPAKGIPPMIVCFQHGHLKNSGRTRRCTRQLVAK
ncbi:MAG: hypothetical protein HN759_07785 [Akkermansiaceae bacterium]|jgi:hypothetical protein|nr:hypothetical protein [Akkermansiaceae bacterium]